MNHWETHLYTYAVALTQGDKIKPENLQGVRDKAIRLGHTEAECLFVEGNTQNYIATGVLSLDEDHEQVSPPTLVPSRTHKICSACGSTDVRADAFAGWDADAGQWILHSTYDAEYCENCETATSLFDVDEATQIEIQALGMVNVVDGSRIAQNSETPDFFDVIVSTTPFESGEIYTLEEHEDMTAEDAARVLSYMGDLYPAAAISSVNCDLGAA